MCLSVLSRNSKTTRPNFTKLLCVLLVAVARSSSDAVAIRYVLPVLRMRSIFIPWDQWVDVHGVVWFARWRCW